MSSSRMRRCGVVPAPPGRRRPRSEGGAAALEFALVLPLLVMLLLGIVTGGVSYSRALGVTNAVREGARFGATATFSTATQATWASDTAARVRATQFDDSSSASSSSTSVCVEMVRTGTPNVSVYSSCSVGGSNAPTLTMPALGSYPETPSSTSLASGTCVVRVVAARKYSVNFALGSVGGTLTRGSVAQYERGTC